jgi:signal transduction histidine kinase
MGSASGSDLSLAALVHDLNNVFQTIGEAAELISEDPQWRRVAGVIFRGLEQGRRIVAGIVEAERETADLDPALDSATEFAQDFAHAARFGPLTVRKNLAGPLTVIAPPAMLERVFTNLFINSARAAAGAHVHGCEIDVFGSETDGAVRILVADNGPGIDPGILPDIFTPGFSTSFGSSGLGLHIVDSFVRQHRGQVSVANRQQGGAEFTIVLPAKNPFPAER